MCVVAQSCLTLWDRMDWDYMDCSLPSSSVRWNFPGDLELGCHFLLQGIFPIHPNPGIEPISLESPTLAESHLGSSVTRECVCVCKQERERERASKRVLSPLRLFKPMDLFCSNHTPYLFSKSFNIYFLPIGYILKNRDFPGKESACNAGNPGWIAGWGRSAREGNGNHSISSVFFPGELHGQRILAGYSPWGYKSRARLGD